MKLKLGDPVLELGVAHRVAFSASGQQLFSLGQQVNIWSVDQPQKIHHVDLLNESKFLAVSAKKSQLAVQSTQGKIEIYDSISLKQIKSFDPISQEESCGILFSPDGKFIIYGSWSGEITAWDWESEIDFFKRKIQQSKITDLVYDPLSQRYAFLIQEREGNGASKQRSYILLIRFRTQETESYFRFRPQFNESYYSIKRNWKSPTSICFSPKGDQIVVASRSNLDIVDIDQRAILLSCSISSGDSPRLAWSPQANIIAITEVGRITLLDAQTLSCLSTYPVRHPTDICFSPDGNYLAVGSWEEGFLYPILRRETPIFIDVKSVRFGANHALELVRNGEAPDGMTIAGNLNLAGNLVFKIPSDLTVKTLDVSRCADLTELPSGLKCSHLIAQSTPLQSLPPDLNVDYKIDLQDCSQLVELPQNLKIGSLNLKNCTSLQHLPEGLDVCFLDMSGCTSFTTWPKHARIRLGSLNLSGCIQLTSLPPWIQKLTSLDVSHCPNLTHLPEGLEIGSWLNIDHTGITALPDSLRKVRLRWQGLLVDARTVFHPQDLTVAEILEERNVEMRRFLIKQFGYDNFILQANPEILDRDQDAGGERQLLRVPMLGDEDLVCVSVNCPSTGNFYIIRVPPTMRTCHQAVAWTAGFDDPSLYHPEQET